MAKYKEVMIITEDEDDRNIFADAVAIVSPESNTIGLHGVNCGLDYLTDLSVELPDIIFLDRNLQGIGCKECIRRIRKLSYLVHVPIIMYSTTELAIDQINSLKSISKRFENEVVPVRLLCEELKMVI